MEGPRVVAVGFVRRQADGAVLVTTGTDGEREFARLIGGSVEFGELAEETVCREFLEEFSLHIERGKRVAVIENFFTLDGEPGHEVVIVHEARLVDASLEDCATIAAVEAGHADAVWASTPDLRARLVPEELRKML